MSDDGLFARTHIDVNDPHDVAMWGLVLGVTSAAVIVAVKKVGTESSRVQAYLKGRPDEAGPTRPPRPR